MSESTTIDKLKQTLRSMIHGKRKKDPGKGSICHDRVKEGVLLAIGNEECKDVWEEREMALATQRFEAVQLENNPDDMDPDEDEWGAMDVEDNLTYHEDTLSVMKGMVSNSKGEDVPVWVATDSLDQ